MTYFTWSKLKIGYYVLTSRHESNQYNQWLSKCEFNLNKKRLQPICQFTSHLTFRINSSEIDKFFETLELCENMQRANTDEWNSFRSQV